MIEMRFKICHPISAIAGLFLAFAPFAAPCAMAEPSDLDLVCSGNSYGKDGDPFPTTETVSFKKEGKNPVMIGLPGPDKPTKASIVSSNQIQLKFSARGLTGEYFNFSGDLFLIHKDGRYTKLRISGARQKRLEEGADQRDVKRARRRGSIDRFSASRSGASGPRSTASG
jgi:hypothetical protein